MENQHLFFDLTLSNLERSSSNLLIYRTLVSQKGAEPGILDTLVGSHTCVNPAVLLEVIVCGIDLKVKYRPGSHRVDIIRIGFFTACKSLIKSPYVYDAALQICGQAWFFADPSFLLAL